MTASAVNVCAVVAAVRAGLPVEDPKLDALVNLTCKIVLSRGQVGAETIQSFLHAGYHGDQIGEVRNGVALKAISNVTEFLPVEIDDAFKATRKSAIRVGRSEDRRASQSA